MKRIRLLAMCAVVCLGAPRVEAQQKPQVQGAQYLDPRTPQGTLRAFAAALSKADLTHAASYLEDAKHVANGDEIRRAMQKGRVKYSVGHLQIAQNADVSTIVFTLNVGSGAYPKMYSSWAVLHLKDGAWSINATRTLNISDDIDPFSSFVSLMSGQRLPGEERDDIEMRVRKMKNLGFLINEIAQDNKDRYTLTNGDLRQTLLSRNPTADVLLRDAQGEPARVSFNAELNGVSWKKVRFPTRTVLLYTGKNRNLAHDSEGRAIVTFADGHSSVVTSARAKLLKLLWSP